MRRKQKIQRRIIYGFWLTLILILSLCLRLYFFVGIGFNDDSYYLEFAEKIYKGVKFVPPNAVEWGVRITVYYPVVFFWKVFGISEISTSIYFLSLSLANIIVTYFLAKELFNEKTGLVAAFLMCIFPLDVIYSTQVGPEIPLQFFSMTSLLFFIKGEKTGKFLYSFISGILIGLSYLTKSVIILLVPILCFYVFLQIFHKKDRLKRYLSKKTFLRYFLMFIGFLIIFLIQLIHFYSLSGEWFYGEKVRQYFFTHDLNSNSDLLWYINMMFNIGPFFGWLHNKPLFGFVYYFVILSVIYLFYKKDKNAIFLAFFFLFSFAFFEYGLQFYCTKIMSYCLYARHPRFLSFFSVPSMILVARFFTFDGKKWRVFVFILGISLLSFTSIFYTYQSWLFLRNGMGYIRETVNYLRKLPEKTIYIPNGWDISKFKFFSQYDDSFISRLRIYECGFINCSDDFNNNGEFITDSYVVTQVDPYTYINKDSYPKFMTTPPNKWLLLTNISLPTLGIFSNFNPRIYYAP
ncbi:MAG: glycosyltransferase family 39 protein [Candidatus Omnitrophica bacterium]|nr:glycosyltransferase family 39 protein [Candidatus Omnitrophota bacterium]